jgi:hypothetical protein
MTRESNRRRIGRDGTEYPAIVVSHSSLRFARDPRQVEIQDDVALGLAGTSGVIELRLPWNLLNVTDPSSHRILDQEERHEPPFDTSAIDRVLVHWSVREVDGTEIDARTLGPFRWEGWDEPRAHLELKPSYEILREMFADLDIPREEVR